MTALASDRAPRSAPRAALRIVAYAALWLAVAVSSVVQQPAAASASQRVVVFVPGVTGTQLEDPATGRLMWGGGSQLVRPRDGGYGLALPISEPDGIDRVRRHPQAAFVPTAPLWVLKLIGFKKVIYRPLAEEFERRGYRRGDLRQPRAGDDFFFFLYDWRYGVLDTAAELDRQLRALAGRRRQTPEVDLICQSNASKVCRYLVKYGGVGLDEAERGEIAEQAPYTVRKLVLVGASNGGALRSLSQLHRGRRYVRGIGRKLLPETVFSVRSLFDDLPVPLEDRFLDPHGKPVHLDLFDAQTWVRYRWSVFREDAESRLASRRREDLFGTREGRIRYLERRLDEAVRLQRLLLADPNGGRSVRLYLLENDSQPTMERAVVVRNGSRWDLLFAGDGGPVRRPQLRVRLQTSGDGHATLASQRTLSKRELSSIAGARRLVGGHFEMLIAPEALAALFEFLDD